MTLTNLINNISGYLEKNKNLKEAIHHLVNYTTIDWHQYCTFPEEGYLRNKVYGSDVFEIFIICWAPNSLSKIHDHASNGCLMKILDGILEEEIYNYELVMMKHFIHVKHDVKYIDNKIGLHKIHNNNDKSTVSIHIYSPPNHKVILYDL